MSEREKSGERKILIVEDNVLTQKLIERTIQGGGFHLLLSGSSMDALSKFQSEKIECVLTDVDLGGGLTGLELAHTMKQLNPQVKIVVMSADETNGAKVGDLGVFLKKPFTRDEFSAALHKLQ